jgi:thiamine biosynthesis lipoprotein
MVASASWPALGSTAGVLVTDAEAMGSARALLEDELAAIDRACSRFRRDSELSRVNAAAGLPVAASELFLEAVEVAIRAAQLTDGDVDPTVGLAMRAIGYDRDFEAVLRDGHGSASPAPVAGWENVQVDRRAGTVRAARGVELDLGATAKALAADLAARRINEALGCGVLVNLGGDVSVAGQAPAGGWRVRVTDDHRGGRDADGQTVSIDSGGLATSSTTVRQWTAGGQRRHHIVDPRSGVSAPVVWRTASVAAGSCVDANIASTAAIVRGARAPAWLRDLGLPSRLVRADGEVVPLGGWPEETVA